MDEVSGGSPYGASTVAGIDGSLSPTKKDLQIAHYQGMYVAKLAARLKRGSQAQG